jgi:polyisoprenoid-binding protein YceI
MRLSRANPARILFAAALAVTLGACGSLLPANNQTTDTAELEAGAYKLDPEHSTILFKVNHLGFSTYVGRFNTVEGALRFDAETPAESRLDVTIHTASADTPSGELNEVLRGRDWFDTERFPTARFESTAITVTDKNTGTVTGNLTLRGVTKPVTLAVTFRGGAYNLLTGAFTLGFQANGVLKRTEFGMGSLVPAIGNEVTLEIHAEFRRIDG